MLRTVTQYGVFTFLGAAIILLLSFVVEKGIKQVDDMLVPCQHGTSYVQGKCRCDGTPFDGNYCSNCKCEHGSCSTDPTTPFSNSDYGCRCPTQSKRFGFLCDLCNTVDEECKGDCKPEFFGARCERICYADLAYDNNNSVCNTMRSSGGSCSTCHGHGTCNDGFCDCDANWFDDGRKQCVKTCPGTPICSGHGTCKLYGDTPGCLCENGWNGPSCDIPCPGMETTGVPCNSRGICNVDFDANTASCDCNEKFRGTDCSIECPGDVVACNGHGTCDDLGACTCQTNVKWSLPSCKCSDELTCSAKGTCNTQEQCECFGNNGGQHCMECKNNWHGDNCDLFCDPYLKANTSDKIDGLFGCYGHGTCLPRSGAMECTCNLDVTKRINVKGAVNDYTSFYDPSMNCGECLDSYFPKQRVVDDHGMPAEYTVPCEGECLPSTCNNRGICNHNYGVPGELLCKCDIDHLDDASFCTECEANWYPLDFGRPKFCNRYCVASGTLPAECDGTIDCVSCNGHGTCTDEGDCLCTGGYTGDECQILCTSSNGKVCGGHGTCESNEIQQLMEHEFEAEGNIPLFSCTCDPQDPVDADSRIDWDEKLALGLVNGTLDDPPRPEYFGQTCDFHCIRPPWEDADECNGLGNCTVVPIKLPNGASVPCKTDTECLSQSILQVVSGDSEWSNKKGPFCHKHDEISGCDKTTDDCYEILLKQRPKKMRSEECIESPSFVHITDGVPSLVVSYEKCKNYAGNDWGADTFENINKTRGCFKDIDGKIYYNSNTSSVQDCSVSTPCIRELNCRDSIDNFNWKQYCDVLEAKKQPLKFANCKSVESYCPAKNIPNYCKPMVGFTDGKNVSQKLDLAYEFDKRRYPFAISDTFRARVDNAKHDAAYYAFELFVSKHSALLRNKSLGASFCSEYVQRYPSINKVRQNRQYLCNGVIQNNNTCNGTLDDSEGYFYKPFEVVCLNEATSYKTYEEALENRGFNCKIQEQSTSPVYGEEDGTKYIDATCQSIKNKFPKCKYPKPCDFNPCLEGYSCANAGTKAICETTGNLNSTCLKGTSERINYNSYSCDIDVQDTSCPYQVTHEIDVAKHCKDNNPIVDIIPILGPNATQNMTVGKYFHFEFLASESVSSSTILELGDAVRIYIRQGQIQINEIEALQACPVTNQQCNDIWSYEPNKWYHMELLLNTTHVTMTRKDTGESITKLLLSNNAITSVRNIPGASLTSYRWLISENDIPSPYSCMYETCDLDVSYREICSDIIRNVRYPILLEPQGDILSTCSNVFQKSRLNHFSSEYETMEDIYNLNWETYCDFYNDMSSSLNVSYTVLEEYENCREFVDPLDGDNQCIIDALEFNWTLSCQQLNDVLVPYTIKSSCQPSCFNHLLNTGDFCEDRKELFIDNTLVKDSQTCSVNWYNYCLQDSKGTLQGTCSAVECSCDAEEYEGISGHSCELHCPIAADGSPCAENQNMGKCAYTSVQKSKLDNAPLDDEGNKIAFDPVWAIEGECQCFLSEGTRNCDIECNGCNNATYGTVNNAVGMKTDPKIVVISNNLANHYVIDGEDDPTVELCMRSNVTFIRCTTGHTFRVVTEQDCPECSLGSYTTLPTSTLPGWVDVNGNSDFTYNFTTSGIFYYVCTSHPNMVGQIIVAPCNVMVSNMGQIGMCDNSRGACVCLPPFVEIDSYVEKDWRGQNITKLERSYNDGLTSGTDLFRIRMMQGRESFIRNALDRYILDYKAEGINDNTLTESQCIEYANTFYGASWGGYGNTGSGCYREGDSIRYNNIDTGQCSTTSVCIAYKVIPAYDGTQDWKAVLASFESQPDAFVCNGKTCSTYEVELLNTLQQTSSRYNFDCNKQCPGTDNTTQIPCSGRGSCSVVGQCVCDPAKIVVGVNEDGVTQQFQVIPGVVIEEKGFTIDKLGRTGYRGEDCAIMCKGFDPEEGDMTKVCNGRGKCDLAGECACEIGYIGDQCQFKCPFTSKVDNLCSGHGVCELAEIQIFDQVFDGSAKQCARSASYDVCQGYSIINDIGFLDLSKITLKKEQILCASPSLEACRIWKDYQNLDYQNTDPFEIYNLTRSSGCILEGNKISYNNKDNDVTCEDGCLCESVDRVRGVCSLESTRVIYHKLGGAEFLKEDGKYNTEYVYDGFEEVTSGAPDLSVSLAECQQYAAGDSSLTYYGAYNNANHPNGCFRQYQVIYWNTIGTVGCDGTNKCIEKKMVNPILFGPDTYTNTMTYCRNNNDCTGFFGDPPDTEGTYFAVRKTGSSILSGRTESYRLVTLEASCSGGKTEIGNYYEVASGAPDLSVSQQECAAYAASVGAGGGGTNQEFVSNRPSGCFFDTSNLVYYNTAVNTYPCDSTYNCIQKPAISFSTSTSQAVMIESCAKVCRSSANCFFFSVESNKCYKQDGCGVRTTGTSTIYELQSPEAGRPYYHYQKALPVLCMKEAGLNFDSKTQAPIIRSLEIHKNMCAGDLIMDTLSNKCVNMTQKPIIDAEFFFDKGSEFQSSMDINCQITGASTAVCAQCACFSDFIYGKWAGFECETCAQGNGKSQCREICPGFDGENLGSMCDGYGKCMFGSEVDPLTGERTFQEAQCICGQEEQFAVREPTLEIVGQYRDTGGIDNDGAINAYFYYTPVPYPQTFTSKFTAQAKCNEFNDLDNVDRGGYCYGVYREYVNSQTLSTYLKLHMGNVGGTFYLYGKYWGKKAISGYSHFYQFKSLELYQGAIGTTQIKYCADIETIKSTGLDTCNHFSSETDSCDKCADGWTGKNCRSVCQRCLLGGSCDESPSETEGSACVCPAGAGALWEYQCCPTGFRVDDMVQWQSKTQRQVDGIRLSLEYDSSTTNELDAAYFCKVCPGVTHLDWMKADALYKVCSGPSRGTCDTISGRLGLKCNCKMNEVTKNRWMGRACSCDESIITAYSLDASIAESTDYGCQIPTGGNGMCPTDDSLQLFFNPPIVYRQDSIYIDGYPYGEPFYGYIAGTVFAREMPMCTPSDPCHTGEGPCGDDTHCAGNLKCFIRNAAEEKLSFNAEKISPTLNYCYHPEETMVGCHPTDYEPKGDSREYFKQFYWDIATSSFKSPALGEYIPYSKDGNLAFVVHQQAFQCPAGRYGITVPTKVTHEYVSNHWCTSGSSVRTYEGNGDNEGSMAERATRCFESCMNQNTPLEGSWTFTAKAFNMNSGGRCYCRDRESASCGKSVMYGYDVYDIKSEGDWNICDKCQPGKYQDTTGNIGWVKVTSGANTDTITQTECETYANWHGKTFYGPPYSSAGFPHGCFIHSTGIYFQQTARTTACSSSAKCLQYGGKGDRHPNCKNCPAGKFGGPIGSWSPGLCETCPPGTRQNDAGTGCDDCPAGKYESGGICYQCQNGRYSTNRQVQCTRCPKGKDTDGQIGTAGTSSSVCRSCPAGKANNVEGADCLDCIAGYVQPSVGQSLCIICGKQEWQNLNGQTTCKTCGVDSPYAGNYGHVGARDTCEYCGTGHVVPSSGTNQGACTACLVGEHQPYTTLQRTCYLCATGKYNPDTGQTNCKNCDKGYYQESQGKTSCKQCAKGDYANVVGLTNCKECAKGQYTNQLGQHGCKNCELGKANNNEGVDGCIDCELHSYADQVGLHTCKNCAAGKYGTGSKLYTNANTCVNCPTGQYNSAAGQPCAQCPTGQYQNQGGQGGCKNCPTGHYNTGSGNTGCTRGCSEVLPGSCLGNNCACYRNRGVSYGGCTGFSDNGLYEWDSYDCSINHVLGNCDACGEDWQWVTQVVEFNPCTFCGYASCRTSGCGWEYYDTGYRCTHAYCYNDGVTCWKSVAWCTGSCSVSWLWGGCAIYSSYDCGNYNHCATSRGGKISGWQGTRYKHCQNSACNCDVPCSAYKKVGCHACIEPKTCSRKKHWFWADC